MPQPNQTVMIPKCNLVFTSVSLTKRTWEQMIYIVVVVGGLVLTRKKN